MEQSSTMRNALRAPASEDLAEELLAEPGIEELLPIEDLAAEIESEVPEEEPGLGLLGGIAKGIVEAPEKYLTGPIKAAALPVAAKGLAGLAEAPQAAKEVFGEEVGTAPTWAEVARVGGVPEAQVPIPAGEPRGIAPLTATELGAFGVPEEIRPPTTVAAPEAIESIGEMVIDPTAPVLGAAGAGLKAGLKYGVLPAAGAIARAAGKGAWGIGKEVGKGAAEAIGETAGTMAGGIETGERVARTAGQFAESTLAAVENLPQNIREVYNNLIPEFKGSYLKYAQLAARTGIPENLVVKNATLMYGPDAFITKAKKTQAQFGVSAENKAFDQLGKEVNNALNRTIQKVSGGYIPTSPKEAGLRIRQGIQRATDELFEETTVRYSDIVENFGDEKLQKSVARSLKADLNAMADAELENLATAISDPARDTHRINHKLLVRIRKNLKDTSLESVVETLQQLGEEAYGTKYHGFFPQIPRTAAAKQLLKDAWKNLHGALITKVAAIDPDIASQLIRNNEKQTNFFNTLEKLGEYGTNADLPGESVFENLVMNGTSVELEALKELIGGTPEFREARGRALAEFIKIPPGETPSFRSSLSNFESQQGKLIVGSLFGADDPIPSISKNVADIPTEGMVLRDFRELLELGKDAGVKNLNSSNTGVVTWIKEMFKSPAAAIEGIATGKGFVSSLEKQAILKDMLETPIEGIIELKGRGLYDDEMLDYAIQEKLKDPKLKQKYVSAAQSGTLTPEMAQAINEQIMASGPDDAYTIVKNYLVESGKTIGVSFIPQASALRRSSYLLNVIGQSQQLSGERKPIFIPEEDRNDIYRAIIESPMDSIQKARNLKALNSSGYLLDISVIMAQDKNKAMIKRLMEGQALQREQKPTELKEDRPDVLKRLEQIQKGVLGQ